MTLLMRNRSPPYCMVYMCHRNFRDISHLYALIKVTIMSVYHMWNGLPLHLFVINLFCHSKQKKGIIYFLKNADTNTFLLSSYESICIYTIYILRYIMCWYIFCSAIIWGQVIEIMYFCLTNALVFSISPVCYTNNRNLTHITYSHKKKLSKNLNG